MIRQQRGDTIIEVLLSIAVLGVIIIGAYVTANHATITIRDSQEHEEALNLAQDQVEDLRSYVSTNPTVDTDVLCFESGSETITGAVENQTPPNGNGQQPDDSCLWDNLGRGPESSGEISTGADAACTTKFINPTPGYCYEVNIYQSDYTIGSDPTNLSQYEVRVVWDSLVNPGQLDQTTLFYRPQ